MSDAASEKGSTKAEQPYGAAGEEEHISSDNLQEEGATEKEAQVRMMSVFEQVRNQIRSQGGLKAPKSSLLELVSKIKDIETATEQTVSGDSVDAEEEKEAEAVKIDCKEEIDIRLEILSKMFEEKLEASKKLLRDEFKVQMSAVRNEMQAYTDQTLKDLEGKRTSGPPRDLRLTHPKPQQEGADAETKRRASAAPLAYRRGKVLTRTQTTTLIPKTSAPIISGSHGKPKSSPKGQSSLVRNHVLSLSGNKSYHDRSPLPPAQPLLQQRRKSIQAKCKTGN